MHHDSHGDESAQEETVSPLRVIVGGQVDLRKICELSVHKVTVSFSPTIVDAPASLPDLQRAATERELIKRYAKQHSDLEVD